MGEQDTNEKKTRRNYNLRVERKKINYGPYRESNEIINPLPPIGEKVYVYEKRVFYKRRGDDERGYVSYIPSRNINFRDSWEKPIVFEIAAYTRGIDNPLDKKNRVVLKASFRSGYVMESTLLTELIATGLYKLIPVGEVKR